MSANYHKYQINLAKLQNTYGKSFEHLNAIEKRVLATAMLEDEIDNGTIQTLLEQNSLETGHLLSNLVERQFLVSDGKGRWTMYQVNKNFIDSTAQDTKLKNNDIQNTVQETAQETVQEKSLRIIHQEKLIIAYCKEPRTIKEIASFLKVKSIWWLRKTYINPLLGDKLWQTIPESPRNRNQKYTSIPPKE